MAPRRGRAGGGRLRVRAGRALHVDGPVPPSAAQGVPGSVAAVTLVAAGDVACGPDIEVNGRQCQQEATARLVEGLDPDAVLVLGDTAYETVTAGSLQAYDASWGRFRGRTHAVVRNHGYYYFR